MDMLSRPFRRWARVNPEISETKGYRDAPSTEANTDSPPLPTSNKAKQKTKFPHTLPNDNSSSSIRKRTMNTAAGSSAHPEESSSRSFDMPGSNASKYENKPSDTTPVASAKKDSEADKLTTLLPAPLAGLPTPVPSTKNVSPNSLAGNKSTEENAQVEEASYSVQQQDSPSYSPPSTTFTSNHGNKSLDVKALPGLPIDQKNHTQSDADELTKPSSPTPVTGDVPANILVAEGDVKQRSSLNEHAEQLPATDGIADDRSSLSTNSTSEKTGHPFQPPTVDDADHPNTQMPIPANTPQEDSNFATKILNRFNPFGNKKINSEKCEAKHVETHELDVDDVIIAVMGPTGSGKSTFIHEATGADTGIGHDLESCTSEIGMIKMPFLDHNIVFVDTPGFDDTKKSDSDILKMISDWLEKTFERKILLSGLLYFHRISDNRMAGTPLKNLRMFEQLCGKNAFKNVILTTTFWGEVDEETGATREAELKGIYWKDMIRRNSSIGRFEGTRDSAFRLIAPFLDEANTRNKLLLQKELVNLDLKLSETHAGQRLRSEIKQLARQQQELLQQIRDELKRPDNTASLQSLMAEYEELKKTSGSLLAQMADLQVPLGRQLMNTITITFGIKRNRARNRREENGTTGATGTPPADSDAKGAITNEATGAPLADLEANDAITDEATGAPLSNSEVTGVTTDEATGAPLANLEAEGATTDEATGVPFAESKAKGAHSRRGKPC